MLLQFKGALGNAPYAKGNYLDTDHHRQPRLHTAV